MGREDSVTTGRCLLPKTAYGPLAEVVGRFLESMASVTGKLWNVSMMSQAVG